MVSQLVPVTNISIGWPDTQLKHSNSKWDLIHNIVTFLCERNEISNEVCKKTILDVNEREKSMTTAIGHGIAIPHASITNLKKPIGACIILKDGVDFEAIDHEPVKIVILVLLPEKDYKKHIRTLSSIVDLTSQPNIKEKLLEMKTPQQVWQEICNFEKSPVI